LTPASVKKKGRLSIGGPSLGVLALGQPASMLSDFAARNFSDAVDFAGRKNARACQEMKKGHPCQGATQCLPLNTQH